MQVRSVGRSDWSGRVAGGCPECGYLWEDAGMRPKELLKLLAFRKLRARPFGNHMGRP